MPQKNFMKNSQKGHVALIILVALFIVSAVIWQAMIRNDSSDQTAAVVKGADFEAITKAGRTTITNAGAKPVTFPNPLDLPIIDDETSCPYCSTDVSAKADAEVFGKKMSEADARKKLTDNGVSVNKPAPATQLNQMPEKAIDAIIAVKTKSNANVKVTGGTEPGHATHGCGLPIFDLQKNPTLDAYLRGGKAVGMTKFGNTKYERDDFIPGYKLECTEELNKPGSAGAAWASHWHCRLIAKSCKAPTDSKTAAPAKGTVAPIGTINENMIKAN